MGDGGFRWCRVGIGPHHKELESLVRLNAELRDLLVGVGVSHLVGKGRRTRESSIGWQASDPVNLLSPAILAQCGKGAAGNAVGTNGRLTL